MKAAVIGASGMGKHHAKWLHRLGCEVVAFVGTSPESVARTAETLRGVFRFPGRGYTDVAEMLASERPDVVSVCSPNELHYQHVRQVLASGAHVMCEKPLVHDWDKSDQQLVTEAQELARAAERAGVVAAVNTQYVAAGEGYRHLTELVGVGELSRYPRSFFMQMESRGGAEGTTYEQIWIDLAPHPLSVLRALVGPGTIVEGSEVCRIAERWVDAWFEVQLEHGEEPVRAHILVRNVREGPLTRRLGVNDLLSDYQGRADEEGVYASFLTLCGVEQKYTDFVQASLTRFLTAIRGEGQPLSTFADGMVDLQRLLGLLAVGERV